MSLLLTLLKTCLQNIAMLMETMAYDDSTENESVPFIDEILVYLKTFLSYVPKKSVVCIEQLLKFMFSMNFSSRLLNEEILDFENLHQVKAVAAFGCLEKLRSAPLPKPKNVPETAPATTSSKLINFLASTSTPEKSKSSTKNSSEEKGIKVFEPHVIQCLKIFTKSDSNVQSSILHLLCRVLHLRVNYCLLDANNIFMEFIMKLLESIETGIIRDSHILTPRIVTFLFHLANQKEKPQMTIPKIINITDTLLANSLIKNGSVEALCQLAYEIYFPCNNSEDGNDRTVAVTSEKESNTQKEVVFSMLLKFIDENMVKKSICLILMKEEKEENLENIRSELTESLVHSLFEKSPFLESFEDFQFTYGMVSLVHTNFQNEHKMKFIRHIQNDCSPIIFNDLAVKIISWKYILDNVSENEFIDNSKYSSDSSDSAEYLSECIRTTLEHAISFIGLENSHFNEMDSFLDYLSILQEFLTVLHELFMKWQVIPNQFVKNSTRNGMLIEGMLHSMKYLSKRPLPTSTRTKELFCTKKSEVAGMFFKLVIRFKDGSHRLLFEVLEHADRMEWNQYDQCMRVHLLKILSSEPMPTDKSHFLLQNHFEELYCANCNFVEQIALEEVFTEIVLDQFQSLTSDETYGVPFAHSISSSCFNIIRNLNGNSTGKAIKYLLEIFFRSPRSQWIDASIRRRAFEILHEKLRKIGDGDQRHVDKSSLKEFKLHFGGDELYGEVANLIEEILDTQNSTKASEQRSVQDVTINEDWICDKADEAIRSNTDRRYIFQLLIGIKSDVKMRKIFESMETNFDTHLISTLIECSFECMMSQFKQDCFQHNAHMNYLKVSAVLKHALNCLSKKLEVIHADAFVNNQNPDAYESLKIEISDHIKIELEELLPCMQTFLRSIIASYLECLIYVEATSVQKFFDENFLRMINFEKLTQFAFVCLNFIQQNQRDSKSVFDACDCLLHILKVQSIFNECTENHFKNEKSKSFFDHLLRVCYSLVHQYFAGNIFKHKNKLAVIVEELKQANGLDSVKGEYYAKAIFLAKFIECAFMPINIGKDNTFISSSCNLSVAKNIIIPLVIETMRSDHLYFFAITPYDIVLSFDWYSDLQSVNRINHLPSIPIDRLNEAEFVEKFVRRINIHGFPSRPYFEEIFMSLLLLVNQENDSNIVDEQEEYQIKSTCLKAIIELLILCKMFPSVGDRSSTSQFHHIPRMTRIKADTIGTKKLHKIQSILSSNDKPSVFYMSNLERAVESDFEGNIIGTRTFLPNQIDLNVLWHIIEGEPFNVGWKNMQYFLAESSIDITSSIQLTFDVITQLIEMNYTQILPQIVKFCEICENRDQFYWIKDTMNKLHDTIHIENIDAHQHIVYCMCKSYAVLIPSLHELNRLCTILGGYLKSSHLMLRMAALKGLFVLFESTIKTNTTIGGLSEEILLLRTFIVQYVAKHGIVDESTLAYSSEHTALVWSLNFYVIETTSKFMDDCNLVANTIISANNLLKKTTNLPVFTSIVHGLERIIISRTITSIFHEKIGKLAVELVKSDNELVSLSALRLLMTCMYIGSNEQLENTERHNGVVQDDPDVIVQSTEVIEVLFHRIKMTTNQTAQIYGNVLCQFIRDLVPPKELLTKVIKELLTISQPHCEVIAKILFQVFRSAIDSTYLRLLQDWLLCSLPNFLSFHIQNVMWYLTVIFISVSINLELIKIFPQILADFEWVSDSAARDKYMKNSSNNDDSGIESKAESIEWNHMATRQRSLFIIACRDFYRCLNAEQQSTFRSVFANMDEMEIKEMLHTL